MIDKVAATRLMQAYVDEGVWPERDLTERYGITSQQYALSEETEKSWIFRYTGIGVEPILGIIPDILVDKYTGRTRISYESADWRSPCNRWKNGVVAEVAMSTLSKEV